MPVTHSLKSGLIMLSVLCTQGCVINIEENQFKELDFNPQREMMGSFEPSQLTVATWNVEHLAYPIDAGCKPRTESDINAMREYVNKVDADKMSVHKDDDKQVKVIAGKFEKAEGPVKGHNVEPVYFDIELNEGKDFNFKLPSTHNTFVYLISGEIEIGKNKHENVKDSTLILLTRGEDLIVKAKSNAKFLVISGKPINEEIARGGPFVMNTKAEILQAVQDYHNGTFVK